MNLALSSLVIVLLVTPALIVRRVYFTGEFSQKYTNNNITTEIISSIFLAFIIHFVSIIFLIHVNVQFDFLTICNLLTGKINKDSVQILETSISKIFAYFFWVTVIVSIIAYFFRNIIRSLKIDRKLKIFRYDNLWYYILSGEILDIEKYNKDKELNSGKVDEIFLDILTIEGDKQYLYKGHIVEFQLAENDNLEYIVLSNPSKKEVGTSIDNIIPSNYFIIPYREVSNINIRFIKIDEESDE